MYEFLMTMKEICEMHAVDYAAANDVKLAQFYFNAAKGYQIKAENLNIQYAQDNQ